MPIAITIIPAMPVVLAEDCIPALDITMAVQIEVPPTKIKIVETAILIGIMLKIPSINTINTNSEHTPLIAIAHVGSEVGLKLSMLLRFFMFKYPYTNL